MPSSPKVFVFLLGLAALVSLGGPTAAEAAPPAPRKLSEIRTIMANSGTSAACPGGLGFRADTQQNPDGSTQPFSIGTGTAFVITGFDFLGGNTPGALAGVDLVIVNAAGTSASYIGLGRGVAGSNGAAGGSVVTPPGVVVKAGANICAVGSGLVVAVVRGFTVKDR